MDPVDHVYDSLQVNTRSDHVRSTLRQSWAVGGTDNAPSGRRGGPCLGVVVIGISTTEQGLALSPFLTVFHVISMI